MDWSAIVLACCALASGGSAPEAEAEAAVLADTDRTNLYEFDFRRRFAATHPNELWRLYGADSARKGDWQDALRHFRHAARYADKYSQHRISLMYWHGVGVERDPVQAYVWADLAAERMYPQFLLLREKMWQALDEGQRQRALRDGVALYAQYGDDVAKPRFAQAMSRARTQVTGSRTGFVGNLAVTTPGPGGELFGGNGSLDLAGMHAQERYDPERYWKVEDALRGDGNVDVGPAEVIDGR
ncbi:hypothetical protein ACFOLC_06900 [Lysobacter cavernae]|uniref:Sel1 repeat family protein n=1 Tax=Lysobacter cavernae TaxID=1685901 RepID=A0ABV7RS12_9GAMM